MRHAAFKYIVQYIYNDIDYNFQLDQLKKEMVWPPPDVSESLNENTFFKQEIRSLRDDLRKLRDENHTLTQDNIKLTEYIRDLENATSAGRIHGNIFYDIFRRQRSFAVSYCMHLK